MSTRIRFTSTDPHTADRVRLVLEAEPEEVQTPQPPKLTSLENLKRWKIQAAAARSQGQHSEWRD